MSNLSESAPSARRFLGLRIAQLEFDRAVDWVFSRAGSDSFSYVVTPNADHVVRLDRAGKDATADAFSAAYEAADLVLCDSRVLQRLARLSGHRLPLVPGSDLTLALLNDSRIAGCRVAVIGGGRKLAAALARHVPQAHFVQHRPPMGVLRNQPAMTAIERFIAAERADLVFFAMGAPQSEIVAHRCLRASRSRGVGLCVGASLEFVVGDKRRAPRWVQRLGMEWAFRLVTEPRRLWRRYLVQDPRVFAIWLRRR